MTTSVVDIGESAKFGGVSLLNKEDVGTGNMLYLYRKISMAKISGREEIIYSPTNPN